MKLLRFCAYFPPEQVSSSHLAEDMYRAYAAAGIHCTCLTPEPSRGVSDQVRREYKNKKEESLYDGFVTVKRFAMMREGRNPVQRALRYFLCAWKTYTHALREADVDAIFVTSTPPIMGALGAMAAKRLSKKYGRKVPVVFNLQDIFPDSLVTANLTKKGSLIWKIGRKIENYTYAHADRIIVISQGFRKNILAKGVAPEKIAVVSNWIDMDAVHPIPKEDNELFEEFGLSRDKFTVVYAGNFGEAQGAEVILEAAGLLKDEPGIQFAIFGGGARFEAAKAQAVGMENLFIHGLLPLERVSQVYSLADVALITCKPGAGGSAMPSKTWSIMACNTPILAAFDQESDLAETLRASGAGSCVAPGDGAALADAIRRAYHQGSSRKNLRDFVEHHAHKDTCIGKYIEIIQNSVKS